MVENKAGGRNTPKKGEQGFQPSKLGKKAPTAGGISAKDVKDSVSNIPGMDNVLLDYLKTLLSKHAYSDLEKHMSSGLWSEEQNKYLLSNIYDEGSVWATYPSSMDKIISLLNLTDEDQVKLLAIDKEGNDSSPILKGLANNPNINFSTCESILESRNSEAILALINNKDVVERLDLLKKSKLAKDFTEISDSIYASFDDPFYDVYNGEPVKKVLTPREQLIQDAQVHGMFRIVRKTSFSEGFKAWRKHFNDVVGEIQVIKHITENGEYIVEQYGGDGQLLYFPPLRKTLTIEELEKYEFLGIGTPIRN